MPIGPTNTKEQKQNVVHQEMKKFSEGKLHSGSSSGPVVTNPAQAKAIAMSEAGLSKKGSHGYGHDVTRRQGHHRNSGHPGAHCVGRRGK